MDCGFVNGWAYLGGGLAGCSSGDGGSEASGSEHCEVCVVL